MSIFARIESLARAERALSAAEGDAGRVLAALVEALRDYIDCPRERLHLVETDGAFITSPEPGQARCEADLELGGGRIRLDFSVDTTSAHATHVEAIGRNWSFKLSNAGALQQCLEEMAFKLQQLACEAAWEAGA